MMMRATVLAASMLLSGATVVQAAKTEIYPNSEDNLIDGVPNILDENYGTENLRRIDDTIDEYWTPQETLEGNRENSSVVFQRKVGIDSVGFGYSQDNTYTTIFDSISNEGDLDSDEKEISLSKLEPFFTWTLKADQATFSSVENRNPAPDDAGNPGTRDHMVTWLVTGGDEYQESRNTYVLAWEDRYRGHWADFDFQDYIVQVDAVRVPLPATLGLLGTGLIGLGVLSRRRGSTR